LGFDIIGHLKKQKNDDDPIYKKHPLKN